MRRVGFKVFYKHVLLVINFINSYTIQYESERSCSMWPGGIGFRGGEDEELPGLPSE